MQEVELQEYDLREQPRALLNHIQSLRQAQVTVTDSVLEHTDKHTEQRILMHKDGLETGAAQTETQHLIPQAARHLPAGA